MIYRYRDDYPLQCPPQEASPPNNLILYRACRADLSVDGVLNKNNFIPVWEQKARKFPAKKECGAKALSFYDNKNKLEQNMLDFPGIGSKIIEVKLNDECGVVLKDGKNHYNLWDLFSPDIVTAIGSDWREVALNG